MKGSRREGEGVDGTTCCGGGVCVFLEGIRWGGEGGTDDRDVVKDERSEMKKAHMRAQQGGHSRHSNRQRSLPQELSETRRRERGRDGEVEKEVGWRE